MQHNAAILWPLDRSTCVSWHLNLRTGEFCWSKVLLPTRLVDHSSCIWIREKTLRVLLSGVAYTISIPFHLCTMFKHFNDKLI